MDRGESVLIIKTNSPGETQEKAAAFAKKLVPGNVVCFYGDMGSGKTTFIKGLLYEINKTPLSEVTSPTFSYMHIYEGTPPVYHFDLYRLSNPNDFISKGLEDYLYDDKGICLLEWAEKINILLPPNHIVISIKMGENNQSRQIMIKYDFKSPL